MDISLSEKKCCVPFCKKRRPDGIGLHRFPNPEKDPERFQRWLIVIGGDILSCEKSLVFKSRKVCTAHFETKYHGTGRLVATAVPTLNLPGQEQEKSLVEKDNQRKKDSQPDHGRQAEQQCLSEHNSSIDQDSLIKQDSQTELYSEAVQDSPDEQCEIDTEALVEIQCNKIFSWQKSYQAGSLLDSSPVEVLKLESSNAYEKVQASVPKDNQCLPQGGDQLQCCECRCVIPKHSVRCVCVSCTDGDICSVCAADDKHSYHYALRVPANATQSEVREVLQKIRRVLLEEIVIKEEMREEDDDPLAATHIVGDASYEDSISQVPNLDMQASYKLPNTTLKEETYSSSVVDPLEVFEGSSPRKSRRSETQYQTDVPTQISKEPSAVLNHLENMLKWAPSSKESKQNQENRTFRHLKEKSQNIHKVDTALINRLSGKRIVLHRLKKMKPVTIFDAVHNKELDIKLDIIPMKDLKIKKMGDLQPKTITLKRPAQTVPERTEGPSTSNKTSNILPIKKIMIPSLDPSMCEKVGRNEHF